MNPRFRAHHPARTGRTGGRALARRRRRERGIAFILVLGALTILTVMLAEVQDESSAEFAGALSSRDALVAEYAAKSAVNLSRLLIASEPTIRKSLAPLFMMLGGGESPQVPVWEFADRLLGAFNDSTGAESFSSFSGIDLTQGKNLGLPGAAFEVRIVDEDSKINVNAPARGDAFSQQRLMTQLYMLMNGAQYDPLFEKRDPDGNFSDRQAICSALIDWADPDQDTTLCDPTVTTAQDMPAEDSYYELLRTRYQRKNAAFDSLEELRRVRGIGEDYWATFIDPDPERPDKRVLTIWGASGAINVNTAAPQTLLAFVMSIAKDDARIKTDPLEAQKFLTVVTLARGFTAGLPPFFSPQAFVSALQGKGKGLAAPLMAAAGLEPIQLKSPDEAKKQVTTESKVFSIYAVGAVKSGKRETRLQIHAVVDFRNAPPPAEPGADGSGGSTGSTPDPSSSADPNATLPPDALGRVLAPSPAGNVVYYRLD